MFKLYVWLILKATIGGRMLLTDTSRDQLFGKWTVCVTKKSTPNSIYLLCCRLSFSSFISVIKCY